MNTLEIKLLEFLLPQGPSPSRLMRQLNHITVLDRDYTGGGFFTTFSHSKDSLRVKVEAPNPFGSVYISSPDLDHGGGAIVWMKDGLINFLEAYCYGDSWPKRDVAEFTLTQEPNNAGAANPLTPLAPEDR